MNINEFAARVERDTRSKYEKFFSDGPNKEILVKNASEASIKQGNKYTKVDVGRSGKFMVVNETREIFGIKAYGVRHTGKRYGTLETVDDYFWGEYSPIRRAA